MQADQPLFRQNLGDDDRLLCGNSPVLGRAFRTGSDGNDAAARVGLCVQPSAAVSCAGTVQHSGRGKYRRSGDVSGVVHLVYDLMSIRDMCVDTGLSRWAGDAGKEETV